MYKNIYLFSFFIIILIICFYSKPVEYFTYYCQVENNKCIEKNDNLGYCGFYQLYNTPAKVFNSYSDCHQYLNKFENLSKEKCLKTSNVGWCTDYLGNGICLEGTPEGPVDMVKYNMCLPTQYHNNPRERNAWFYSNT